VSDRTQTVSLERGLVQRFLNAEGEEDSWLEAAKELQVALSQPDQGETYTEIRDRLLALSRHPDPCTGCSECELAQELIEAREELKRAEEERDRWMARCKGAAAFLRNLASREPAKSEWKPDTYEDRMGMLELGAEADREQEKQQRLDDERVSTAVDFLASWRYCPVSQASDPSRSCLEDAAKQLLAALPAAVSDSSTGEAERLRELEAAGEKLAMEARIRLQEITQDDIDHPAWSGPQADALKAWNQARNSLRPEQPPTDNSAPSDSQGERCPTCHSSVRADRRTIWEHDDPSPCDDRWHCDPASTQGEPGGEEDWPPELTIGRETLAGRTTEMFIIPPSEVADRSAGEFIETHRYLPAAVPSEPSVLEPITREAMVLGFVMGALARPSEDNYPRDSEVVDRVLRAAQSHDDLYPRLASLAREKAAALKGGEGR
jgi:hypothetical protein